MCVCTLYSLCVCTLYSLCVYTLYSLWVTSADICVNSGMCNYNTSNILKYSSDALRGFGVNTTTPPHSNVRKRLFKLRIWSRRSKYTRAASGNRIVSRTVRWKDAVKKSDVRIKSRPVVKLGVMNCRSVDNKLHYIFDNCKDNNLDIIRIRIILFRKYMTLVGVI